MLFVFNVFCLYCLSRTMINCYYDPSRKKKKVVHDFIQKIEKAAIENEYVSEVKVTLEDFNYYINEAYERGNRCTWVV